MDIHVERHRSSFGGKFETTVGAHDLLLMGADLPYWRGDYLDFVAPRTDTDKGSDIGKAQLERLLGGAFTRGGAEFDENRGYVVLDCSAPK